MTIPVYGRELLSGGSRYSAQAVPNEELTADFYESAIAFLDKNGLEQYEISNFARDGRRSRHNLKYWRRLPYLGFGLDAHSMVRTEDGSACRLNNSDLLAEYLKNSVSSVLRGLDPSEELEEAWFLGLRLSSGIVWQSLVEEFGLDQLEGFRPVVSELRQLGLLEDQCGVLRLTRRGVLFSNEVFAQFLGVSGARPAVGNPVIQVR